MTLQELHSNEELRNFEFPVTRHKIYLAHAGVCALPRRVSQAISEYAAGCTEADQEVVLPGAWLRDLRVLAASVIHSQPEEIAFVGPTSLGLSFVAAGLNISRHEHVLLYADDYPSNVYPWVSLEKRGAGVRYLNVRELGLIRPRDVFAQLDENTRLVALSSCHFLAGYRIALEEIGAYLRERNILFCVDAIQTIGAFATPAHSADFMAADAHKWMLGPCAAGILYVRREIQDRLAPVVHGWHNIRSPNYVAQEELVYKPDARRYEAGTHNILGLVGLRAGLELIQEIGLEEISRDLLRKRAWLLPALQEKGYQVLQGDAPPENSGPMIAFTHPEKDIAEIHAKLEHARVITSLRADRVGRRYIRLAPHFYNTNAELERTLALL